MNQNLKEYAVLPSFKTESPKARVTLFSDENAIKSLDYFDELYETLVKKDLDSNFDLRLYNMGRGKYQTFDDWTDNKNNLLTSIMEDYSQADKDSAINITNFKDESCVVDNELEASQARMACEEFIALFKTRGELQMLKQALLGNVLAIQELKQARGTSVVEELREILTTGIALMPIINKYELTGV